MGKKCALGIDLGGTSVKLAVVDEAGQILTSTEIATKAEEGPDKIQERIVEASKGLFQDYKPVAAGAAVAGQIVPQTGEVFFAPNLKWHHVPLQKSLTEKLKMAVFVTEDVRSAALAEWHFGAAKGCKDFICIFAGTGIGGGIVSGGHMLEGASNTAGEIGHMIIDMNGPPCTCGNYGCFEAFGSGWAIASQAQKLVKENPEKGTTLLKKCKNNASLIDAKMVFEAALEGDLLSHSVVERAKQALVSGAISLVNGLNPERLIFGGSISKAIPNLLPAVREGIKKRALKAAQTNLEVVEAKLGKEAGVIGAAVFALEKLT